MQGFNMGRYVPPELEGVVSGNKLAGKHALGARARKSGQGILTVRFEMPFPIWCTTCPKPTIIGQGVRFNAEKKKVGAYYSTPIFSFRMKHVACGGWIEIRTDPQNTAYVVTEGANKRDLGEDRLQEGEIRIGATEEERARLEGDPFAKLEGKVEDARQSASEKSRIEELYRAKERDWDDPGEANRRLRSSFRIDRKQRQKEGKATEALKDRMSLGIDLLEESEGDRRRAGFVDFGTIDGDQAVASAKSRPLFAGLNDGPPSLAQKINGTKVKPSSHTKRVKESKTKAAIALEQRRAALQRTLDRNTRAAKDPFLGNTGPALAKLDFKRKQSISSQAEVRPQDHGQPAALVLYEDSD